MEQYLDNTGKPQYDGFAIEIVERISKSAGFDYDLYVSSDGKYGVYDRNTGRIDGAIGEVVSGVSNYLLIL